MSKVTELGRELLQAVRYQYADRVASLLKQFRSAIPEEHDEVQNTALHWAVMNDQPNIVDLLLVYQFPKNTPNHDYLTPIVLAATLGHWHCVEIFIKHNKGNNTNGFGDVLLYAVKAQQFLVAKQLLKSGANCHARWTGTQFTALHWAVENKDVAMIELLLAHECDQTLKDNSNSSALKRSVEKDDWQCVIALCSRGAQPNQQDLNDALLEAAQANQYLAVSALLSVGADPNAARSHQRRSALHWAVVHDSPELFALLIGANARLDSYDKDNQTPVHLALQLNNKRVASWFVALEVDVDIRDNSQAQETINHIAIRQGGKESFVTSIHQENLRPCPLMLAIVQNKQERLAELVQAGSSLMVKLALNGKTPLQYAIELEQLGLISYITQQLNGESSVEVAFDEACKKGDWHIARAIDKERAMMAELDDKYYQQLAWYSASNASIKGDFMQQASQQAEKEHCDKARFYRLLSTSKTAKYRQFLFWNAEPTKTTTFCTKQYETLEAHQNIQQNAQPIL